MSEQVKIGLVLQAYVRCVYASFFYDFFKELKISWISWNNWIDLKPDIMSKILNSNISRSEDCCII